MARVRLEKSLADYVVIAISPVLIMAVAGSLAFFLLELAYSGQYAAGQYAERTRWILGWFVFASVLVSRVAIEQGTERAMALGGGLAVATGLACFRLAPDGALAALAILAVIWWSIHRLTFDCTLIDDSEDATGVGLLQSAGMDQGEQVPDDDARESGDPVSGWLQRWFGKKKNRAPGVWVVYFALAALPLFGLGQLRIPASDTARRNFAFQLLMIYVAASLGLLLTTSFLGLRRYLRQRKLTMPATMTLSWLTTGLVLIGVILGLALLLPRPDSSAAPTDLFKQVAQLGEASKHAFQRDGGEKGEGAAGKGQPGKPDQPAQPPNPEGPAGNNPAQPPQGPDPNAQPGKQQDPNGKPDEGAQNPDQQNAQNDQNPAVPPENMPDQPAEQQANAGKPPPEMQADEPPPANAKDKPPADPQAGQKPDPNAAPQNQPQAQPQQQGQPPKPDQPQQGQPQQGPQPQQPPPQQQQGQQQQQQAPQPLPQQDQPAKEPPPSPSELFSKMGEWLTVFGRWIFWAVLAVAAAWFVWRNWRTFLEGLSRIWAELCGLFGLRGRPAAAADDAENLEPALPVRSFSSFEDPFASGRASRLKPAELVRLTFDALQAWAADNNLPRRPEQTPLEFADTIARQVPLMANDVQQMAQIYARMAYAAQAPGKDSTDVMARLWREMSV